MDAINGIEPVTVLKTKSAQIIARAQESRQPIIITQNGKASAVVQDIESFEEQRRALALLKLMAQGEEEIRSGKGLTDQKVRKQLARKLKELRDA